MAWLERFAFAIVITVLTVSVVSSAQELPALSISPGKVTMLQGETRTFRAVGRDGRIRHNVRWNISPEHAAKLTTSGDEVVLQAETESTSLTLIASVEGDSAQATVDVAANRKLPAGTVLWTVAPLPGCKSKKLSQAVPSATGPDLYDEEECPQGEFVRALTADGRELWRRQITGSGGVLDSRPVTQPVADAGQHLDPHRASVCDSVSSGMTKDEVSKPVTEHHLTVEKNQWRSDHWELEEPGYRCTISFDANTATVIKKRKTVVTD